MRKYLRPLLTELLWLAVAFVVTGLICRFVFFMDLRHGTLDLHLHDTYFVFTIATIFIPVFLLVTFVLYFSKEIGRRFGRTLPNIILFTAGLLLIILLDFVSKEVIKMGVTMTGGWTMYPPLSDLPQVEPGNIEISPLAMGLLRSFTVMQILITIALLYSAFQWGRGGKKNKEEDLIPKLLSH